jgi:hypothetical protein
MSLAVGHLVDPDAPQAVQEVLARPERLVYHPLQHAPHRGPVDAHEPGHHALGGVAHQEGAGVLEGAGEAGSGPGPGHLLADYPTLGALNAPHLAAQQAARPEHVQVAPGPDGAIVRGPGLEAAARTAHTPPDGPDHVHQHPLLAVLHELDRHHPLAAQPQQPLE